MKSVEIVGVTKKLSSKFKTSAEHYRAIQNMMLNAYQIGVEFSKSEIDGIEKAFKLLKK